METDRDKVNRKGINKRGTYMKNIKNKNGTMLIETALVLVILLVILLGITEFARAWFTKNSLKNAVRQGARVAVVTPAASLTTSFQCASSTTCPNANVLTNAVCCQPGVKPKTGEPAINVTLECRDASNAIVACSAVAPNGTVRVQAILNNPNFYVIGGGIWPWPKSLNLIVAASMRYE